MRATDRETAMHILHGLARFLDYRLRFYEYPDFIEILRVRHRKEAYRG